MTPTGHYTFNEAARLASFRLPPDKVISSSRLRGWFRSRHDRPAVITNADYPGEAAISFLGRIDATMALRLVQAGVSPRRLKRVHAQAADILKTPYPFARDGFFVDVASGEAYERAAWWFGVEVDSVRAAVDFERTIRRDAVRQ